MLPFPFSLSTQILPPIFSTNSLQRISPNPVPFSPEVPALVTVTSMRNSLLRMSAIMPTPVSVTEMIIKLGESIFSELDRVIDPFSGVNFIELEVKFRITVVSRLESKKARVLGLMLLIREIFLASA